jgi:hypothetical protein
MPKFVLPSKLDHLLWGIRDTGGEPEVGVLHPRQQSEPLKDSMRLNTYIVQSAVGLEDGKYLFKKYERERTRISPRYCVYFHHNELN